MDVIFDSDPSSGKGFTIGGKARNLFALGAAGFRVPRWAVIPAETLQVLLPEPSTEPDFAARIDACIFPEHLIRSIADAFAPDTLFAVRSSAIDEDGSGQSFAGQYESFLFVPAGGLEQHIKAVWKSVTSDRIAVYREHHGLQQGHQIAVIVQEMIPAEVSGVVFGVDPVSGDRAARVVSALYGLGEGLVSGHLDADVFTVKGNDIRAQIADKKTQIVFDTNARSGTVLTDVGDARASAPSLTDKQVHALSRLAAKCAQLFGRPQDIEFAVHSETIYLLQARPVTGLPRLVDKTAGYVLWDNSNIIESYPGVTTPLTFSFISTSYETAYTLFSRYLGVSDRVLEENRNVFANTLGLINGRVYYNLKSWYHMLAMLPGYSINARFMETMMGVKESFDIPERYRMSRGLAWLRLMRMAVQMIARLVSLPAQRRKFAKLLEEKITEYKQIPYAEQTTEQLLGLYRSFERELLNEWKAPLLNDFFAMIFFGMLRKQCAQISGNEQTNIHNDLLCGSNDIISVQPVVRMLALSTQVRAMPELTDLFVQEEEHAILERLSRDASPAAVEIKKEIDRYIRDFGERCVGELKLETVSYTQDPARLIRLLKSYVANGLTESSISRDAEQELRRNAEAEMSERLRGKPVKKWLFGKILNKTRELVSSRENLRYERTRAFGIVRELFSQLGKKFHSEDILAAPGDIFYLTKEELFAFLEGRSVTQDLAALAALRKEEFAQYAAGEPPAERFATFGPVYHANDFFSPERAIPVTGDLKGTGCCPGIVQAKVCVVSDPSEIGSLNGAILVTRSTDPGWVTLFPGAGGIIVEKGSLLSHSAIVSREMGKPCIVGVTGLLKTLQTGDEIVMNGSSGEITILQKAL